MTAAATLRSSPFGQWYLQFATGINTLLVVNTLVVDPAGIFTIGTAASPVNAAVTAQIIFPDQGAINTMWDPTSSAKGWFHMDPPPCTGSKNRRSV